jgi:hypothetical protein
MSRETEKRVLKKSMMVDGFAGIFFAVEFAVEYLPHHSTLPCCGRNCNVRTPLDLAHKPEESNQGWPEPFN